jgi:signal transduction histidine kinase
VHLSPVFRTTGFRIGVVFLFLFGLTSLCVFVYIYTQTSQYQLQLIDASLARRIKTLSDLAPALRLRVLEDSVRADSRPREPRGLFSASGEHLAGNLQALPKPIALDRAFEQKLEDANGSPQVLRIMVHRLESGEWLAVGRDLHDAEEFDEILAQAMESGGALVLVLGLLGAVAMGLASSRRIAVVTRSIQRIVNGHLAERLPTHGRGGDIDQLATVVNGMLDELERLMREVKGVTDDVAHDLRTPLTRLMAGLEQAERRARTPEDYADAVRNAIEEARGLLATFTALLRISEVENGLRRQDFVPVDLSRIARDAVELFEPLAEEKGVALSLDAGQANGVILGDAQLLFDAACNLVSNAVKFTPPDGSVVVEISRDGSEVELAVRDTGPGISEAERDAVFRRFYRSEQSRHTPGNGLGLSMVAAVAKLHEMKLSVRDASPGCRISLSGTGR